MFTQAGPFKYHWWPFFSISLDLILGGPSNSCSHKVPIVNNKMCYFFSFGEAEMKLISNNQSLSFFSPLVSVKNKNEKCNSTKDLNAKKALESA